MKLEDIDILNNWRRTYSDLRTELRAVKSTKPTMVQFGQVYVKHDAVMIAVRQVTLPIIEEKLNEARTKLMMLGITEFPE